MSKVFVVSDTHWNHDNMITLAGRKFDNVTQMNEHMIAAWNAVVDPNSIVYHCGDVAYQYRHSGHITYDELMSRLNGEKHLVWGNHDIECNDKADDGTNKIVNHEAWASTQPYLEIKFGKSRFVLCHYPLEQWRNAHKGWYHVHGHCHGTLKRVIPHRMDVGVDCWPNYAPVNLETIRDMMAKEKFVPQDHHGDSDNKIQYM